MADEDMVFKARHLKLKPGQVYTVSHDVDPLSFIRGPSVTGDRLCGDFDGDWRSRFGHFEHDEGPEDAPGHEDDGEDMIDIDEILDAMDVSGAIDTMARGLELFGQPVDRPSHEAPEDVPGHEAVEEPSKGPSLR